MVLKNQDPNDEMRERIQEILFSPRKSSKKGRGLQLLSGWRFPIT